MKNTEKFVFLVAMEEEAFYLKESFNFKPSKFENYYTSSKYNNVSLVITGVGLSNVLSTLSYCINNDLFNNNDNFINIGYVGSPLYKVGDIVQISSIKRLFEPKKVSGLNKTFETKSLFSENVYKSTTLYTADDFVENQELPQKDCVVDMEGYYIICILSKIYSIKIVSDNLCLNDCNNASRSTLIQKAWDDIIEKLHNVIK